MEEKTNAHDSGELRLYDELNWVPGSPCITAVVRHTDGKESVIGKIIYAIDPEANKPMYRAVYPNGEELAPPSHRLPSIKRIFIENKDAIAKIAYAQQEERALDPLYSNGKPDELPPPTLVKSPYQPHIRPSHQAKIGRTRSRAKSASRGR